MRPSTPTFITILPSTSTHSRASRTKLAWYFRVIAVRSPVGPTVSVAAPRRTSAAGQLTSAGTACAPCANLAENVPAAEPADGELFGATAPLVAAPALTPSKKQSADAPTSARPYFCSRPLLS